MSISILQHNSNHAAAATECDVVLGPTTDHKALIICVGWHGSTDNPVLTCEDDLPYHNFYRSDITATVFAAAHCMFKVFIVGNGRGSAGLTIKAKSGTDVGDFVVTVCEVDPGAGKLLGGGFFAETTRGIGQTIIDIDTGTLDASDFFLFVTGYGQPNNSVHSSDLRGSFSGSMTPIDMESTAIGSVGNFWQEFAGSLLGNTTGTHYVLDTTATTAAQVNLHLFAAGIYGALTLPSVNFSPDTGEFATAPSVVLSLGIPGLSDIPGMDIHYTTDGSTPTSSSPVYSSPIPIVGPTMVVKAFAVDPSGFWSDGGVLSATYDIYTGTVSNPNNIIDGDDTSYAELVCNGSTGDVVAVRVNTMAGTTGAPGSIKVDFEVTENDLVAPSQTLPAWKVIGIISGVETVLASGVVGAGVLARGIVSLTVPPGTLASHLQAKIAAICEIPGSTGGVKVRVYAAYLLIP